MMALGSKLPITYQRALNFNSEKSTLCWFMALTLSKDGYAMHKEGFRCPLLSAWVASTFITISQCLWQLNMLWTVQGRFPSICHNKIQDLTAMILTTISVFNHHLILLNPVCKSFFCSASSIVVIFIFKNYSIIKIHPWGRSASRSWRFCS